MAWIPRAQTSLPQCPRVRDSACLIAIAHQGPAAVLGAQEPVHQHGPPEGKVKFNVLLKVGAQLVTVEVVAEGETLPRDQHVHLTPHRYRKEGFQAVCREQKWGESRVTQPCASAVLSLTTPAAGEDAGSATQKPGPDEPACGWGMQTQTPYPLICGFKEQTKLSASASRMW